MLRTLFLTCILNFTFSPILKGNVWLPDIFSEGMVLQRNVKIKVWGNAAPRERVAVTLRGRSAVTRADRQGKWEVYIQPLSAGGPFTMNVLGKNLITINNVWIGDVFMISGETFGNSIASEQSSLEGNNSSHISFFKLPEQAALRPTELDKREIKWNKSSVNNFLDQTALALALDVPVGFIVNQYPQAHLKAWINPDSLKSYPEYQETLALLEAQYTSAENFFSSQGKTNPGDYPSVIYNGMVFPIAGYTVSGLVFQFNFMDAEHAFYTKKLYQLVLQSFRDNWSDTSLPVLFVNQAQPNGNFNIKHIVELLDMQQTLLDFNQVGILNQFGKSEISVTELAQALETIAAKNIANYKPPVFTNSQRVGEKLIAHFNANAPLHFSDKYGYGKGFEVAGKNREFYPAKAFISNDSTIEVSSDLVTAPVAVRYGFNYLFEGNLKVQNSATEALPFKTDNWAYTTDTSSYRTVWLPFEQVDTLQMLENYYENLATKTIDSTKIGLPQKKLRQYSAREAGINAVKEILNLETGESQLTIPVHILDREENNGLVTESLIINTEANVYLNAKFIYTEKKENQKVYIVDKVNNYLSDTLLAAGYALLEFSPRKIDGLDSLQTENILQKSIAKGKSFMGRKVYDYQKIIDFLETRKYVIDKSQIHLAQLDTASSNRLDILLTAAIDDRVQSVFLQRHILEIGNEMVDNDYSVPTEFYKLVDIEDLIGLIAPRKFTLLNPVDPKGSSLTQGKVNLLTRRCRYTYYRNNVSGNLKIKTSSNAGIKLTAGYAEIIKNSLMEHAVE